MERVKHHRTGLTLLEVVTVLLILIVIAALFLPTTRNAREASRRTQCLNNMRKVAVAIHSFASSNRSRLPAQAYYPSKPEGAGDRLEIYEGRSWVVGLIPYFEHSDLYDRWSLDQPWNSTDESVPGQGSNSTLADWKFPPLTCPNDPSAADVNGGLSYVVNCGIGDIEWFTRTGQRSLRRVESGQHYMAEPFDWNGDGILPPDDLEDAEITSGFTLFAPEFGSTGDSYHQSQQRRTHTLGKIYDGASNTIMLGENINAGTRPGGTKPSWADPQAASNALILPIDSLGVSAGSPANGGFSTLIVTEPHHPAINRSLSSGDGEAPFLNSNHPGIASVSFCDGAVSALSDQIDMRVYVRLVTPGGTRKRELQGFATEGAIESD